MIVSECNTQFVRNYFTLRLLHVRSSESFVLCTYQRNRVDGSMRYIIFKVVVTSNRITCFREVNEETNCMFVASTSTLLITSANLHMFERSFALSAGFIIHGDLNSFSLSILSFCFENRTLVWQL